MIDHVSLPTNLVLFLHDNAGLHVRWSGVVWIYRFFTRETSGEESPHDILGVFARMFELVQSNPLMF